MTVKNCVHHFPKLLVYPNTLQIAKGRNDYFDSAFLFSTVLLEYDSNLPRFFDSFPLNTEASLLPKFGRPSRQFFRAWLRLLQRLQPYLPKLHSGSRNLPLPK